MKKGKMEVKCMMSRRLFLFLLFFIPLLSLSIQSYSISNNEIFISGVPLIFTLMASGHFFFLLWIFIGAITVFCAAAVFYLKKLKKVQKELHAKDKMIIDISLDLQKANTVITDQKVLIGKGQPESGSFFEMLFQSASDAISFCDNDGKLKYANPAFYSLFDIENDSCYDLITQQLNFDPPDYQLRKKQALLDSGFFETLLGIKDKSGNHLNLSVRSVIVKNEHDDVCGTLTISRDITKLKQEHENLIKANAEAEASNKLKSSFLANISHEIRTPLNSVVGFSNLLLSNDITKEIREEYIEQINHNSEKLLQIIGDIIDLSRLESSQIEITYEETSLNAIIREIVEEIRQVIRRNEKSIILNVKNQFEDNSELIFTDKIWLKRVLNHLMDNAVKFTLDGSIELSYYRQDENVFFKIRDTGVGIRKENLKRIFEEFKQEIDGHHRPFEGLGIGLTLAKEVVERMGGKIFVQSEKGVGSEFSFCIPYRPAGGSKNRLKLMEDGHIATQLDWSLKKCLIVDDNKDILIYLSRILSDTGIIIITARTGYEAIDVIRSVPDIDVILLDMQMPEMNGIETAKEIRKVRKNIPVIAQTAFVFEDDKDIILEAGCNACLIKPIRKDHLLMVMSSFLKPN